MNQNLYKNSKLYKLPENIYEKQFNHDVEAVKFLVFVRSEESLEHELLEMLLNIIKALKLAENEAEIILFKDTIIMSDVLNKYGVKNVLCFGSETKHLNINMELSLYKLYRFTSYQLLMVHDLIDVYNNKKYKTTLWNLLQKMFKL